jgi:RNA polymerase sigma-70 factor (ECF subfamily)
MSEDAGGTKDAPLPSDPTEVTEAVQALQAGDPRGAEVLFRLHRGKLVVFFASQTPLAHEADDLAQETLARACRKIDQFRGESLFATWLRRIAENVWKNADRYHRRIKRGAPTVPLAEPAGDQAEDGESVDLDRTDVGQIEADPESALLALEETELLRAAMAQLPPGMRQVIELRVWDDLGYEEIAERAGVSAGTVKSQLHEARKRLEPLLRDHFHDTRF